MTIAATPAAEAGFSPSPAPLLDAEGELETAGHLIRGLQLAIDVDECADGRALKALAVAVEERIERAAEFVKMARSCRAR